MSKYKLTCGCEAVDSGISFSKKGITRDYKKCVDYVSYCAKCTYDEWDKYGMFNDHEISKLIDLVYDKAKKD